VEDGDIVAIVAWLRTLPPLEWSSVRKAESATMDQQRGSQLARRLTSAGRGVYSPRHDDDIHSRSSTPPRFRGTGARSRVIVSLPPDETFRGTYP
jgi:hypothetical protein